MTSRLRTRIRPTLGFALVDAVAALVVIVSATILVFALARRERVEAMSEGSLANLRTMGALIGNYAFDNRDAYPNYTWTTTYAPTSFPDLKSSSDAISAAANQYVDIVRRRGNDPTFPPITALVPYVSFLHLVLVDYSADRASAPWAIAPADRYRVNWTRDIPGFRAGVYAPFQPISSLSPSPSWRWSYASSYQIEPAFYFADRGSETTGFFYQTGSESSYSFSNTFVLSTFPRRFLGEVRYPSAKIVSSETAQWRLGATDIFWGSADARLASLRADGAALVRASGDANPGFQPHLPTSGVPTTLTYQASSSSPWNPPIVTPDGIAPSGATFTFPARFRWTSEGLKGRDFDGPEVHLP